ncbi:MAG: hypothetical protein M0C28_00580 [Candidatus Moduliflexus flocculans]|nr:hypothetical protein [Candidatus Moduliflexus flocculans]
MPSLESSFKLASAGPVIGRFTQDRTAGRPRRGRRPAQVHPAQHLPADRARASARTSSSSLAADRFLTPALINHRRVRAWSRARSGASATSRSSSTPTSSSTRAASSVHLEDLFTGAYDSSPGQPVGAPGRRRPLPDEQRVQGRRHLPHRPQRAGRRGGPDGDAREGPARQVRGLAGRAHPPAGLLPDPEGGGPDAGSARSWPRPCRPGPSSSSSSATRPRCSRSSGPSTGSRSSCRASLDQLVRLLGNLRKNNRIYFRIMAPKPGLFLKGEELPNLPPTLKSMFASPRASAAGPTEITRSTLAEYQIARSPTPSRAGRPSPSGSANRRTPPCARPLLAAAAAPRRPGLLARGRRAPEMGAADPRGFPEGQVRRRLRLLRRDAGPGPQGGEASRRPRRSSTCRSCRRPTAPSSSARATAARSTASARTARPSSGSRPPRWTSPASVQDRKGVLYAATSPNGRIYKITDKGKGEAVLRPGREVRLGPAVHGLGRALGGGRGERRHLPHLAARRGPDVLQGRGEPHPLPGADGPRRRRRRAAAATGSSTGSARTAGPSVVFETPYEEVRSLALDREGRIYAAASGTPTRARKDEARRRAGPARRRGRHHGQRHGRRRPAGDRRGARGRGLRPRDGGALYRITGRGPGQAPVELRGRDDLHPALAGGRRARSSSAPAERGRIYSVDREERIALLLQQSSEQVYQLDAPRLQDLRAVEQSLLLRPAARRSSGSPGSTSAPVLDARTLASWGASSGTPRRPPGHRSAPEPERQHR